VQQVETPLNIYHHPVNRFVAGFIGSPTMNFIPGAVTANGTHTFHQEGSGISLPLGGPAAGRLPAGASIILGIRPEHIHAERPAGIDHVSPFTARIEVVEPVGNETFLYFSTGGPGQFVARIATDHPPKVGTSVELLIDMSKIHFFDKETERGL
jgi:multiple sugar transport system ATP-binding protein